MSLINPAQFAVWQSNPANAALSDADAATAGSVPTLTPRPGTVTATGLANVWGYPKYSAFVAAVNAAIAGGGAAAVECAGLPALLAVGFDASNPQVQGLVGGFVAIPNSGITAADAQNALYTVSYPFSDVPPVAADVTAARAALATQQALQTAQSLAANQYNAAITWIGQPTTPPTTAQVLAYLGTQH